MLRLKAVGQETVTNWYVRSYFCGGEANVAVSLANYGMDAQFLHLLR